MSTIGNLGRKYWKSIGWLTIVVLGVMFLSSAREATAGRRHITLAPMGDMPLYVHDYFPDAPTAYRFATTHHDLLTNFPCYCGCVNMGHEHNADCYIKQIDADASTVVYDDHASYCGICVEITMDVMRLWEKGLQIEAIHDFIVKTYSHRGPST